MELTQGNGSSNSNVSSYSRRSSLGSSMSASYQDEVGCDADSVEPHVHGPHMVDPQHGLADLDDLSGTPVGLGTSSMLSQDGGLGALQDHADMHGGAGANIGSAQQLLKTGDEASLEFKPGTTWKLAYQRNNKSKDQKNLRCFPNCCLGFGHQDGFCGQSIAVVFDYAPSAINASALIACSEFAVDGSRPHAIGSLITLDQINKHGAEDEAKKQFCYMKGHHIVLNKQQQQQHESGLKPRPGRAQSLFEFNRNLKGWHYGFLGSKKTRNMYHVFRAYVLERAQDGVGPAELPKYKVLAMCQSPPWQMYCRRRKYNHIVQKKSRRVVGSSASEAAEAELQIQRQIDEEASKAAAAKALARRAASGSRGRARASSAHAHNHDSKDLLRRTEPIKRSRGGQSGAESSSSLKRRPKAISIPAPPLLGAGDRRRASSLKDNLLGDPRADGLDLGSISLDHQGSADYEAQFASLQRGGAPLPNLSSPSGLYADLRFKRLVELIKQVGLPQPLVPHKFSLNGSRMAHFSQSMCTFLVHWQELQFIWPPHYPYAVHEYMVRSDDPSDEDADAVLNAYEHFALFLLQQGSFRTELTNFAQRHPDGFKTADPYNVSVFALKLFTDFYQDFLVDREYKRLGRAGSRGLLGSHDAHVKDESDRSTATWASPAADHPSHQSSSFVDISVTPRGNNLNQEDFDLLQASLQTPRGLSAPHQWAGMGGAGLTGSNFRFAGLNSRAFDNGGAPHASSFAGSASSSSSCSIPRDLKPLATLTPKSSFVMTPKGSFLLSPKNSFSISGKLGAHHESKMDSDLMNLPSPGFRSPRIFAQVDSFLEDTKDYSSLSQGALVSPTSKDAALKAFMTRGPTSSLLAQSAGASSSST
ncbi:Hypothetical Protein FCC1311_084912 [Hondaea fermentalgiana]|uniref:Uncharacterized protein n=1 Tax=Hondaea fermentalgiana TaxID=2315210 RepID=A0A2R5GMZ6_9STRA|nr:Hypothetical Protein FCC1311_084912 [Hondaea fermentalgiana]|eukprot:GBG32266.1 Hypothetical Protein FCC1311_084912 [Hondaea fermentalgiana]